MQIPLFSKYAPTKLSEFGEKGGVVKMLLAMESMHILIIGGAGVGKTSLCTTIVKEYYGDTPTKHIEDNVLILNNLKDQGVSFYRTDVKCFCQTKSSITKKKKIIIVDDIDTISESGQQVFLSCIDLFKKNIIFLATCRCASKILENIHSRMVAVQLFPFQRVFLESLLARIADQEEIVIEEGVSLAIVERCNHSVRILLNYLEKFRLLKQPVTLTLVQAQCSIVQEWYLKDLIDFVLAKNLRSAMDLVEKVYAEGYSVMDMLDAIFTFIKQGQCRLNEEQSYRCIKVLCKYIYIVNHVHAHPIELFFFLNDCIAQCHLTPTASAAS